MDSSFELLRKYDVFQEVAFCDAEIMKRKQEIDGYRMLQKRLEGLPKKLTHRVNVRN